MIDIIVDGASIAEVFDDTEKKLSRVPSLESNKYSL